LAHNGNEDRVAILYNLDTLKFKEVFELDRFPGSRKALVGRFRHNSPLKKVLIPGFYPLANQTAAK